MDIGASFCSGRSTRFVGKPEGGQQCIFDLFWLFFGESIQTWGLRGTRGEVKPQPPDKSSTEWPDVLLGVNQLWIRKRCWNLEYLFSGSWISTSVPPIRLNNFLLFEQPNCKICVVALFIYDFWWKMKKMFKLSIFRYSTMQVNVCHQVHPGCTISNA